MQNKRRLLITVGILVGLAVGLFILFKGQRVPNTGPTEADSPGTVVIDNTDQLRDILLQRQYAVVTEELVTYILAKIDNNIEHAYIIGRPAVGSNGSVSFSVQTEQPSRRFKVNLDRATHFDKIIFSVPQTGYKKILNVYAAESIGE